MLILIGTPTRAILYPILSDMPDCYRFEQIRITLRRPPAFPVFRWLPRLSHSTHGRSSAAGRGRPPAAAAAPDRKSTRLNSSHVKISYAVFCLKKKTRNSELPVMG